MEFSHNNKRKYQELDDLVIQILLDYDMCSVPIDIFKLAEKLNFKLIKFAELNASKQSELRSMNMECFTIRKPINGYDDLILIYYDDTQPINRIRFSIAHEFKHILCNEWDYDEQQESDANHFARALLIHPSIIACLKNKDSYEISKNFILSHESASYAIEAFNKRYEYFGNKLFPNETEFISAFKNKNLFSNEVLKLNNIIK